MILGWWLSMMILGRWLAMDNPGFGHSCDDFQYKVTLYDDPQYATFDR